MVDEQARLAATLRQVGPDAATTCGDWSTLELAAHLVFGEAAGGLGAVGGRLAVGRLHLRLDGLAAATSSRAVERTARRGFDDLLARLDPEPPRLLRAALVAPVGLCELFVHHEDVRRANAMGRRDPHHEPPASALEPVVDFLLAYQRRRLRPTALKVRRPGCPDRRVTGGPDADPVEVCGDSGEIVLWLAGRSATAEVAITDPAGRLAGIALGL